MFNKKIGVNFLHRHPMSETYLNITDNHVIVDKKDWEEVVELLKEKTLNSKFGEIYSEKDMINFAKYIWEYKDAGEPNKNYLDYFEDWFEMAKHYPNEGLCKGDPPSPISYPYSVKVSVKLRKKQYNKTLDVWFCTINGKQSGFKTRNVEWFSLGLEDAIRSFVNSEVKSFRITNQ